MLSRWFARFKLDPETLRQQKWFALFGERLLAPALWQGSTRALSGAVAAGIFACWFPIPMHSLIAVGLALAFSLNLPLALLAVWFNNPLTLPFMYLYAYRTGCLVLHQTPEPFHLSWTLHWLEQEAATLVPLPARQPAAGGTHRPERRRPDRAAVATAQAVARCPPPVSPLTIV